MEINGSSQAVTSSATRSSEKNTTVATDKIVSEVTDTINAQVSRTKEVKEVDVKKAIDKLNKFLEDDKTHAEYEIHPLFKDIMIKIVDDKTGDVVLEVPPKKIVDMIAKMCEMVGVMVDEKA